MVSDFMHFVTSCLPTSHKYDHVALREDKRDDDYLERRVEDWKAKFPVTDSLSKPFFDHRSYTKKLIKAMLIIPVNDSTADHIAEHLCATAKKNPFLSDDILSRIASCSDKQFSSKELRIEIHTRVSHTQFQSR